MKRRSVRRAYENIRPDEAARERMLRNILDSSEIPPAGKDKAIKMRKAWRFVLVAALIATLVGTVVVAEDLLRVPVKETAAFTSNDGTIEFYLDINDEVIGEVIPEVKVVPHFFTGEEAKHVATVLFGDAEFYEDEAFDLVTFSKGEIQEKLDRWKKYASEDALKDLFTEHADEPEYISMALEAVNKSIDRYEALYENAPEEIVHTPCQWKLRNSIEYIYPEEEWEAHYSNDSNEEINVRVIADGVHYTYGLGQRDNETFRVNNISALMGRDISPYNIDKEIMNAELCRTAEPTEEQLAAAKAKAENWLNQMQLGNWQVDECYVETRGTGEQTEYRICVNAVPVFYGIPAMRREQIGALRGREEGKTYYYYTDVNFEFAPNGELLFFHMYSPVDIVGSSYADQALSIDELMEIAKEKLVASSASNYGIYAALSNEIGCRITVRDVDYSLTRMTDEDTRDPFIYSLGASLSGDVEFYNMVSGQIVRVEENRVLLVLDAKNGDIVGRG